MENNKIKGTKTEANLMAAFSGESQARNKYDYYASKAKAEGYEQIAGIFASTALNEKEHAKIWFKILHGGSVPSTIENLLDGIAGEHYEHAEMYLEFEKTARAEGFNDIAALFKGVGDIERQHEQRYKALVKNIKEGKVFKREKEVVWECRNCGHHHKGKEAEKVCDICRHPMAFFEIVCENY